MEDLETRWWSRDTIAVVTGSKQNIGFAIARGLAMAGVTTVMTDRDEPKGLEALDALKQQQGIDPAALHFHVLDVTNPASIHELAAWIKAKFGRLDILVNKAGIILLNPPETMTVAASKLVIDTNSFGPMRMIEILMPLFNGSSPHGARIINVSTAASRMDALRHRSVVDKLSNIENLSIETINETVDEFLGDVEHGRVVEKGWSPIFGVYDYCFSKLVLNAYTRMVARDLAREGRKIFVNCMCPGLTSTPMTKNNGHSAEVGADTAIWLALLPASRCSSGEFFSRRRETGFDHIPFYMEGDGSNVLLEEFDESVRTLSAPKDPVFFK